MTPLPIIPRSSIDMGERGRTVYRGIEELAESIEQNGLIQPIVLEPILNGRQESLLSTDGLWITYKLSAGGRRLTALDFLGVTELHHAITSVPGTYGYVLKGEDQSSPLKSLLTEIAENLDRHNLDWRDETRLIVRAFRLARAEANSHGEQLIMRDFGASVGCGYDNLKAAVNIVNDLHENPEKYANITSIRGALALKLGLEADAVNKLLHERGLKSIPVREQSAPSNGEEPITISSEEIVIELSEEFFHCDGIRALATYNNELDHIITDPDYGVSVERLEASVANASIGVAQDSVEQTLTQFAEFFYHAFLALNDSGFLVFFYDLDHHEKLQKMATTVGFKVQRWPLIWHKTDYRSNASPQSNFCKNIEYAMVCRKPGAVLQKIQMSSVFSCSSEGITKELHHPFAKPRELWKWIYSAVTVPGQTVFDPFVGSGSSAIAAIEHGLTPCGCEIQEQHFHQGLENIKRAYEKKCGKVRFE